jgi:16S rRNA (uracil1498-N3)-methyltransferase
MMHTIYLPDWTDTKKEMRLSEQEGRHTVQVLRMQSGDQVRAVNGKGMEGFGTLSVKSKKETYFEPREVIQHAEPELLLHLAIAPTKQMERLEWLLEKCTEIGVSRFSFILSKNSERRNLQTERLERIVLSATKQSGRVFLPHIQPLIRFEALIEDKKKGWIAHCKEEFSRETIPGKHYHSDAPIYIGPEGDFTSDEIAYALKNGCESITLGHSRLRTETAGLVACVQTLTEIQRHDKD